MIEKAKESAEFIKKSGVENIDFALVLGSGLGTLVEKFTDKKEIPYSSIPNFPQTTVKGHSGKLTFGKLQGASVIALQGRFHFYEGFSLEEIVYPIYVFHYLGIKNLILTTASGALNPNYRPGDFMVFKDFISLIPFTFSNLMKEQKRVKKRYLNQELIEKMELSALRHGIKLHQGVFACVTGPTYETKSEIKFYGKFADAISMSTVPEIIIGHHLGMKVVAVSCITNSAVGTTDTKTTHTEVLEVASTGGKKLALILEDILQER